MNLFCLFVCLFVSGIIQKLQAPKSGERVENRSREKVDPNERKDIQGFFSLIVGSGTRMQVAVALSSLARENSGGRVS